MQAAQATFNVLYTVESENILVSLLLAALVPFVVNHLYHFFQEVWPRVLHRFLIRWVFYREVAVVEQDGERDSSEMNRLVDSAILIEMVLEYVGHLERQARRYHEHRQQKSADAAGRTADTERSFSNPAEVDNDIAGEEWAPSATTLSDLPYAAYRYAPIPGQHAGGSSASSAQVHASHNENGDTVVDGGGPSGSATMARYLHENYQLTLAPTNEVAMEVEPGLFLRYVSATQTLQQLKEQRERATQQLRESKDPGQAAIAAGGALEDYLLYDLINKLQENGKKRKRRRRHERYGDDDSEQGNTTFLQPFGPTGDGDEDDNESNSGDGEDSEEINTPDEEAARQQEQAPRQILLQCRQLRTSGQQSAYLRWHQHQMHRAPEQEKATNGRTHPGTAGHVGDDDDASAAERARILMPKTRIENFVARARAWYMTQLRKTEGQFLFLFYPAASEASTALGKRVGAAGIDDDNGDDDWCDAGGSGDDGGPDLSDYLVVRRYPIPGSQSRGVGGAINRGGKTFDSLFFTQKPRVMRLLRDFQNCTGKFSIPGVAHRMTWLVHGPPGTGKTSLVKAMARHLGRHVVVLQMGTIRTASVLSAWMHEASVTCQGEEEVEEDVYSEDSYQNTWAMSKTVKLNPSEVIYLLEDVDAIGKIDGLLKSETPPSSPGDSDTASDGGKGSSASHDSVAKVDEGETPEKSTPSDAADSDAASESSHSEEAHSTNETDEGDGEEDEDADEDEEETESAKQRKAAKKQQRMEALMHEILKEFQKDAITVDTLLRVFNGVAVPKGRIIVMTTNHPERLDPRLTHPSVVTLKINMDDLNAEEATRMIRHYYPEYTAAARMPPGTPAAALREEEQRMHEAVKARVEALLARRERLDAAHPSDSVRPSHNTYNGSSAGKMNPARLEQACAECASVEELLHCLESGKYEVRDNVY